MIMTPFNRLPVSAQEKKQIQGDNFAEMAGL
jgi:hypothetical protein